MSEPNSTLARIESRIDKSVSANTQVANNGSLGFSSVEQIMEFAKVMAIASTAIPKHLRENVGACLAVAIQASEWQMSPFAVANKTYVVNDRIAFEAQLVAAVILKRAPIIGRIAYTYTGEGPKRRCKTSARLSEDGSTVEYESPEVGQIPTKNSPLWKSDPDQQLGYFSVRAMCRRHFPDVILGIYTPEEIAEAVDIQAQVQPIQRGRVGSITEQRQLERQQAQQPTPEPEPPVVEELEPEPTPEPPVKPQKPDSGPTAKELLDELLIKAKTLNLGKSILQDRLVEHGYLKPGLAVDGLPASELADILDSWTEFAEKLENKA